MRRHLILLIPCIALAAPAALAQRGQPPAPPTPSFRNVDCAYVQIKAQGTTFIVRCHQLAAAGPVLSLPVAQSYDYTGKYSSGNLEGMSNATQDAWRTQNIASIVTTFYQVRLYPDFPAVLRLRVFDSLLGLGQTVTVVDGAEIVENP